MERSEREREKHTVDHSKIFLKAIDQKNEALIIMRFYNLLSSKTGVLEIHTVVSLESVAAAVLLWRRKTETREQIL